MSHCPTNRRRSAASGTRPRARTQPPRVRARRRPSPSAAVVALAFCDRVVVEWSRPDPNHGVGRPIDRARACSCPRFPGIPPPAHAAECVLKPSASPEPRLKERPPPPGPNRVRSERATDKSRDLGPAPRSGSPHGMGGGDFLKRTGPIIVLSVVGEQQSHRASGVPGMAEVAANLTPPDRDLTFTQLYRALYPSLVRLAFLIVDQNDLAEEVVQDAFARLHPRWDRVAEPASYVRRSVINACRDVLRRRRVERTVLGRFRPATTSPARLHRRRAGAPAATGSTSPWCCATTRACPNHRSPRRWDAPSGP